MDDFYSPASMRSLVHNSMVENLLQKEKRSNERTPDSLTLPRTKKMDKRLSSGYGSSLDDDTAGMFTENVVVMRPKPELGEHGTPGKKRLGVRHSFEGIIEKEKSPRERGSWSPMSKIAKMWWLAHHRHKPHDHANNNHHVDEGVHSSDELSDIDDEIIDADEEAGFKKRGKSKSEGRINELLQSPLRHSNDLELYSDFLSAQGHEHPYSIKMSHQRGSKNSPTPASTPAASTEDADGSLQSSLVDANDNELQCQFYLRETKKKTTDSNKRSKKVKKSPLMNFFKKSKTSSENVCPPTPQGKWFGHPLPDICDGDNLPKPIMTLLETLFHDGPFTSGIFRKPANEKKKREFLEYMDQHEECSTEEVPVMVVSSTLKEFLRQMPDCLLVSDLYSEWMETTTIQDAEERLNKVKSLVSRLPSSHHCLLRHLVCVLQQITVHAARHNHMNAYNLAICTAPSLLWNVRTSSNANTGLLGSETEGLEKIPLVVQHMIEHCREIFGADIVTLFGAPRVQDDDEDEENDGGDGDVMGAAPSSSSSVVAGKQQRDSSTDSDSMHSMLSLHDTHTGLAHRDNSSIDSIGGSEIESSPRVPKSHLSPTNLSRDSGLYSSDNQLYEDSNAESEPHKATSHSHSCKQSITRSVSQFDEPVTKDTDNATTSAAGAAATTNAMSRSYDAVLDTCGQSSSSLLASPALSSNTLPVPPPRKHRMTSAGSGSGSDSEKVLQHPAVVAVGGSRVAIRPCASASSIADLRRHKYYGQKRVSNDSLGSVEEYPVEQFHARHGDLGTLHKSDSGARLYINEDVVNSAQFTEPSVDTKLSSGAGKHHLRRERVEKSSSLPPPLRRSWTEDVESTAVSTSVSHTSSSSRPQPPTSLATASAPSNTLSDSFKQAHKDFGDVRSSEEKAPTIPKPPETVAVIQVPKGSLTFQPPPQRSEPVQRRRAGMTEKGADIFPLHIRRSLCYPDTLPSRDVVAEIPRCAQLVRALNLEPSKTPSSTSPSKRPNQPPTYQEALRRKSQLNITEKDARDEKQRQERARKLYEQSVQIYSQQQEESRPSQPPSYEQAVQRSEQIKRQTSPTKETKKTGRVRRHGHRSSDTKLDSQARSSSGHKVTRSKSDSSEHLHKLAAKLQLNESTDSEEEWPAVQRRLRMSKSVERVPSKDKLSEVKITPRQDRGGYDSGSDSNAETTQVKPRTKIQSLRNRDWHKELSEAYSQVFYQPPEAKEPKYAYVRPTPKEETQSVDRQRRRSWVPPVHPTKDLVQVDYAKDYTLHSSHAAAASKAPTVVLATRSQPVSPVKQAIVRPVKQTVPLKATAGTHNPVSSDSGKSTGKSSVNDSDSDGGFKEQGLGWSVAKLRNLYGGGDKTNVEAKFGKHAAHFYTGPESEPPQPGRRSACHVREKTNPNAEEAYL